MVVDKITENKYIIKALYKTAFIYKTIKHMRFNLLLEQNCSNFASSNLKSDDTALIATLLSKLNDANTVGTILRLNSQIFGIRFEDRLSNIVVER